MNGDPDKWLTYAKAIEERQHYTLDHSYWISIILKCAARFVKHLRTGTWDAAIVVAPESVGDPFASIIGFFIDAMRNHEILARRLKDILLEALSTCYMELGEHENLVSQASALCQELKRLVDACEHADDGRIARIRLAFVEKAFMKKNRRFFELIFRNKLPPCKTKKDAFAAYIEQWMDALCDAETNSIENVVVRNAHRTSLLCHDFAIGVTSDLVNPTACVSLTIPYSGLIAQVLSAAVLYRRWKGPRAVIGIDDAKDHSSSSTEANRPFITAFASLATAAHAIDNVSAYYRGETRQRPKILLSDQVSPKGSSTLPDLTSLMAPRPPEMTVPAYLQNLGRVVSASTAYFGAVENCAKTDYLKMLTIEAHDKFHVLCNCFSYWHLLSPESKERDLLQSEVKRQFYELGERMEDLARGFGEYEEQLKKTDRAQELDNGADPYASADNAIIFLKGLVQRVFADQSLTWKDRPIKCFKNAFDYIWAGTIKSKHGELIKSFKEVTAYYHRNTYKTVYQKIKNIGSMTQTEKGLKLEAKRRRTRQLLDRDLKLIAAADPDRIPGNSR